MTVRQLLASLDSHELSEWQAFYQLEYQRAHKAEENPAVVEQNLKAFFRSANE